MSSSPTQPSEQATPLLYPQPQPAHSPPPRLPHAPISQQPPQQRHHLRSRTQLAKQQQQQQQREEREITESAQREIGQEELEEEQLPECLEALLCYVQPESLRCQIRKEVFRVSTELVRLESAYLSL